ncbi:hypothetical protein OCS_04550 [Ophiocordyceps sinensis CO18]|uniref:Uncharacterized protein n=1 Tax=Ophiocordyceps sinensis (strain Co18 / CGMCC 3.14243) TaxID=911162 RepID=T5A2S2_OPHSC|nr:hypothetical protein OCS_04550 [Ophiocordyceps sinensis CO18]
MSRTPRLDGYARALARLYEPMILLDILGKDCAPQVTTRYTPGSLVGARRCFLRNLAVMCDYTKGGATTTAIALEEGPAYFTFWLATNHDSSAAAAAGFLKDVLARLMAVCDAAGDVGGKGDAEAERELIKAVQAAPQVCKTVLGALGDGAGTSRQEMRVRATAAWTSNINALPVLRVFPREECSGPLSTSLPVPTRLPGATHRATRCGSRGRLDSRLVGAGVPSAVALHRSSGVARARRKGARRGCAAAAGAAPGLRRCAGRGADVHGPAPGRHADDVAGHAESHGSGVGPAPRRVAELPGAARPPRRLKRGRSRGRGRLSPRVHAEVQLLDHFHAHRLSFAADDRYIACSKPACFCCRLYFRHHPARCVEPDSHGNLHLNWGLARLRDGARDARWAEQRAVLDNMNDDIRDVVFMAVLAGPRPARPDSLSGITRSGLEDSEDERSVSAIESSDMIH